MADAILRTRYTGDDSQFQKTNQSVIRGGKKLATETERSMKRVGNATRQAEGRMKKLAAAAAATVAVVGKIGREILDDKAAIAERLDLSQKSGADFERFNKLAGVLSAFGVQADDTADTLAELNLSLAEALQGDATKENAFKSLGIDIEKMGELAPVDRFLALSDAYKAADGDAAALVATSKLLGDDASRKVLEGLSLGSGNISELSKKITSITQQEAEVIRDQSRSLALAAYNSKFRGAQVGTSVDVERGGALGAIGEGFVGGRAPLDEAKARDAGKGMGEGIKSALGGAGGSSGIPGEFTRQFGTGGHDGTNKRGSFRVPLSAAAKTSQQKTEKFFKETRAKQDMLAESVGEIASIITDWSAIA